MPLLALPPLLYIAQIDPMVQNIQTLTFEGVDVREAIRGWVRQVGNPSFSIDPAVQGTVTANFTNVTGAVALQNILAQVDATYRMEAGVIHVVRKGGAEGPHRSNAAPVTAPRLPAHEAIIALFRANAIRYVSSVVASPGLDYDLQGMPYDQAATALAKMADLQLTFENGVAYLKPNPLLYGGFGGGGIVGGGNAFAPAGVIVAPAMEPQAVSRPAQMVVKKAISVKPAGKKPALKAKPKKSKK